MIAFVKVAVETLEYEEIAQHEEELKEFGLFVDQVTRETLSAECFQFAGKTNEQQSGDEFGHVRTNVNDAVHDDHFREIVLLLL